MAPIVLLERGINIRPLIGIGQRFKPLAIVSTPLGLGLTVFVLVPVFFIVFAGKKPFLIRPICISRRTLEWDVCIDENTVLVQDPFAMSQTGIVARPFRAPLVLNHFILLS